MEYKENLFYVEVVSEGKTIQLKAEALLVATGVQPNTDLLNLSNTKIKTDSKGYVVVDEYLETTSPGVYALGDITGKYFYRHSVNFEGEFLFRTLYQEKKKSPIDYPPVPHAVFTHPQVAKVGKTEEQLRKEGIDYIAAKNPYSSSATGMARLSDSGFVKILVDKKIQKGPRSTRDRRRGLERDSYVHSSDDDARHLGRSLENDLHTSRFTRNRTERGAKSERTFTNKRMMGIFKIYEICSAN